MRGTGSVRKRALACGVAAVMALTGCGADAGPTDPPPSSSPSSEEGGGGGGAGATPTALPTDLRECPPADKDATATEVRVPPKVEGYRYDVPAGFSADGTGGLGQIATAEGEDYDASYYMLAGADGVEVLTLVHYSTLAGGPVADGCGRLELDEVLARLADHNERSDSEVTSAPELIEVAGVPAVVEERSYPGAGISVRHYWIYGSTDMLNVQCQWTSHESEVRTGCDALMESLSLG